MSNQHLKHKFDWDIDCLTGRDFRLKLNLTIKKYLFDYVFSKVATINVESKPSQPEYEVPEKYYKMLSQLMMPTWKDIKEQLKEDKIVLDNGNIKKARFRKEGEDYLFMITIEGEYHDK